jgi:hypothetical protein
METGNDLSMNNTIYQIYISDSEELPEQIKSCMSNVKDHRNDYNHQLLHNKEVRAFISSSFPHQVLQAFDRLKPYAYKADLARLCLLQKFGGWYLDSTVTLPSALPKIAEDVEMIVFKDAPNPLTSGNWNVNNGAIYAKANHPVLEIAINLIVDHGRTRFYGRTSLDPTGPGVLGRALAIHGPDRGIITGWYHQLTPMHQIKNLAYILPVGKILAFGKATAGTRNGLGLEAYGDKGTNSYEEMYRNRDIYIPENDV